jgi:transposase
MIADRHNPDQLATPANVRLAASRDTLAEALHGQLTRPHRFVLKHNLDMVEHLEQAGEHLDGERVRGAVEAALKPFRALSARLVTIPGVGATVASVIAVEIGVGDDALADRRALDIVGGRASVPSFRVVKQSWGFTSITTTTSPDAYSKAALKAA